MVRKVKQGTQLVKVVLPRRWVRQLDHLVTMGLFLNRADVIRRSIRTLISSHPEAEKVD